MIGSNEKATRYSGVDTRAILLENIDRNNLANVTVLPCAAGTHHTERELFVRGWDYGQSRVIGGVHFPTDVESGRIEATAMVALMMQNADFKTDFAAARTELRKGLGLSQ